MLTFVVAKKKEKIVLELSIEEKQIGFATLDDSADILHLRWIEIVDKFRSKGMGNLMLSYITDNILQNHQEFHITVINEETLPFYFSFFESKKFEKEIIFDWIKDSDNHLEIHVDKGILKNKPINKLKK